MHVSYQSGSERVVFAAESSLVIEALEIVHVTCT